MLAGSFRELQAHARKMSAVVRDSLAQRELISLCTADRLSKVVNVRVGDNYDEISSGRSSFGTPLPGVLGSYFETWQPSGVDRYVLSKAYLHLHASPAPNTAAHELL